MLRTSTIISCVFLSSTLFADDQLSLGLDIDGKYQQQHYSQDDAKTYRLALQPWLTHGNWLFYGELPFEAHDNTLSSSQTTFTRTSTGRLLRRITLTPQTTTTTKKDQQEGIADASLGLSYGLFQQDWQHAVAIDYKFANGDAASGLGSDSTETSLSWATTYTLQQIKLNSQVGYLWVGGNNPSKNKDYSFISTGVSWQAHPKLKMSLYYNTQSEPYANAPDQGYLQSRLDWQMLNYLKVYCTYGQYLQQHISLPESEFSIGTKFLF